MSDPISASLLPLGQQQFFDNNGDPLSNGTVTFTVPPVGNNTLKDTWQDPNRTVLNTNPVVLDAAGRCTVYGYGQYVMTVKDSLGNQIFQALTSDAFLDANGAQLPFLWCGEASQVDNAFTVSPDPALPNPSVLSPGQPLSFSIGVGGNDGASTLAITNFTGTFALKKIGLNGIEDLQGGELVSGQTAFGIYDGTQIVLFGCSRNTQFTNFCGTSTGDVDAQVLTPPGINDVLTGQVFCFIVGNELTNDGATTVQLNVGTPLNLFKPSPIGPVALAGGELQAGCLALCVYDGTQAVLLNPNPESLFNNATTSQIVTSSNDGTIYRANGANLAVALPKATDVWAGFTVYGIADSFQITLTPDAADTIGGGSAGATDTFQVGSTFALVCDGVGAWYLLSQTGNSTSGGGGANLAVRAWILWSGSGVLSAQNASMTHVSTGKYSVALSGGFVYTHGGALMTGTKSGGSTGYYGAAAADITGTDPTFTLNTFSGAAASDGDGIGLLIVFGR